MTILKFNDFQCNILFFFILSFIKSRERFEFNFFSLTLESIYIIIWSTLKIYHLCLNTDRIKYLKRYSEYIFAVIFDYILGIPEYNLSR